MATPDAAHNGTIFVDVGAAPVTPATALKGINNVSLTQDRTVIDVTDFPETDKVKILGLKSGTITLSGFKDAGDGGQIILDAAFLSGVDVTVRLLFDGAAGFDVVVKVASIDIAPAIDDVVPITYNLEITVDSSGASVTAV